MATRATAGSRSIFSDARAGKPETMGYADDELYKRRDEHLNT